MDVQIEKVDNGYIVTTNKYPIQALVFHNLKEALAWIAGYLQ